MIDAGLALHDVPQADALRRNYTRLIDGKPVALHTIANARSMVARLTNHGGRLVQLLAPDRNGSLADMVLGYDSIDQLLAGHASAGATIGRYAGRVRGARFMLEGKVQRLTANEGPHHLHGGTLGSRFKVFDVDRADARSVRFRYHFGDAKRATGATARLS